MAYRYAFHGELRTHAIGRERTVTYRVLHLPPDLLAVEPFASTPRVRIVGELAEHPIRGAWQSGGPGLRFLMVSPALSKAARIAVGDVVECRFDLDDPDAVEMDPDLERAIAASSVATATWARLTPGRRRGYVALVASARTAATRGKRVVEAIASLEAGAPPWKRR
ncbi:MAG: YdeI/OmpD-associated family protein [Burkholderiales bacterium]